MIECNAVAKLVHFSAPECFFQLAKAKSHGLASTCTSLGGQKVGNLAACKALTMDNNGNTFNWKGGMCYFKRCRDVTDFKPTNKAGGWDVYTHRCETGASKERMYQFKHISLIDTV